MNNIRLQARNAKLIAERHQYPGWNPLLRGRRWADNINGFSINGYRGRDLEAGGTEGDIHAISLRMESVHTHPDTEIVAPNSDPSFQIPIISEIVRPEPAGDLGDKRTSSSILGEPNPRHRFTRSTPETKPELDTETAHVRRSKKLHVQLVKQIVTIFCSSWLSLLLPFVPAGFASNYTNLPPVVKFILNFFAIFPSASIVDMAMDEVMLSVGNTVGVLIYMTFGNIVQLVTSILLLKARQVEILKTSLVGGILGGVLLTMGTSYFAGGIYRLEQFFNVSSASYVANFLTLSVASLIIPTAFHIFANSTTEKIAAQSRGTSVVLLFVYGIYLFFQLKTHAHIFNPEADMNKKNLFKRAAKDASEGMVIQPRPSSTSIADSIGEKEEPQLSMKIGVVTLIIGTVILAFNTTFAVGSIDGLTAHHASPSFVGLILLPFLNNDLMPITCARMDKLDLSIMASAGKSLQTSLLIMPLIVIIAWVWGIDDMSLLFDGFQVVSLFMAVLLFNFLIAGGKSNYLQGVLLLSIYVMIAIAAWYG
ncbi:hypothetical protein DID88_007572 [Monilinia fructigena]|uniref:Vacuolar calcium ion transporter n=1 Tax=Monilinia fructigena TaxID=38457 RepID=A0A395J7W3_9HELO|nr:hypothetical protein DID88_007572 [Monilinia fructigena]